VGTDQRTRRALVRGWDVAYQLRNRLYGDLHPTDACRLRYFGHRHSAATALSEKQNEYDVEYAWHRICRQWTKRDLARAGRDNRNRLLDSDYVRRARV